MEININIALKYLGLFKHSVNLDLRKFSKYFAITCLSSRYFLQLAQLELPFFAWCELNCERTYSI